MTWPARSLKDPVTRLSERELDNEKDRARLAMVAAQDRIINRMRVVAETAYSKAHLALLTCRTEQEVVRVERAYLDGVQMLQKAIDANA